MIFPFISRVLCCSSQPVGRRGLSHASALAAAAFSVAVLVTAAHPAAAQTPCGGCSATGGAGSGKIGVVIPLS